MPIFPVVSVCPRFQRRECRFCDTAPYLSLPRPDTSHRGICPRAPRVDVQNAFSSLSLAGNNFVGISNDKEILAQMLENWGNMEQIDLRSELPSFQTVQKLFMSFPDWSKIIFEILSELLLQTVQK